MPPRAVVVPGLLILGGAVVAMVAVVAASAAVLVVAGLLLLAGIAVTTVRARRRLPGRGRKVAVVGGVVALCLAIFVPASMNVDRCDRIESGGDLSGCDLSDQDLSAENLRQADLRDADLGGADLSGAVLVAADLRGARLRGANLSEARMARARLGDADLRRANLSGARASDVTATGVDLRDADMEGTVLVRSDLTGATLAGARLPDADLSGATLAGLEVPGIDLSGATLEGADLSGANLTGGHLPGADLSDADLRNANLSEADLADAEDLGDGASASRPAELDGADLRGANLSGADLTTVSAPGANFDGADLTGTVLVANDFVGAAGIGSDDLSAAFGVPGSRVAGEAARRGVVLHTYDEIVQAVTPVRDGRAVPTVQPYAPNDEFHPAIVFDTAVPLPGAPSWADAVRDAWAPTSIRFAELVVVTSGGREGVETCPYVYVGGPFDGNPAPSITRYVRTVTVRVFAAHNHGLVGERTFRGADPPPCPTFEGTGTTELEGAAPDVGALARPWLQDLINPPAEREAPL